MFFESENPTELAKEVFWLAWKSSKTLGMGFLRDDSMATKDDVWHNIVGQEDYPCNIRTSDIFYADYVFGRMMKLGIKVENNGITIRDGELRSDYQSWCNTYPTIEELVSTAYIQMGEN